MSGFLANLLSRSRGTADVVRPRLASLFEPGAQRASHAASGSSGDAEADAHVVSASPLAAPIIASPAQGLALSRDAGSSRPAPPARHGHEVPPHGDPHADADADARIGPRARGEGWDAGDETHAFADGTRWLSARADGGAAGAARGRRQRGDRGDRADRSADAAAATAAAAASAFGAFDGGSPTPMRAGAMSASAVRTALAQVLGASAGLGATRGGNASHGDADAWDAALASGAMPRAALIAVARPPAALSPMPLAAPSSRRQSDAAASRARADAAAADPIVEINIGRIEIRAAVERGSDRKAAARSSPVMGLDEYLQTRARGGSR